MTADGLRLAFQKISAQVLKQIAPDRGPVSAGEIKINVGPVKRVLVEALGQGGAGGPPGPDREAWAERTAFAAAGRIKDLIARGLNRNPTPAEADPAVLFAGVKEFFRKLAGRAEPIARQTWEAVGPPRDGRGETT